MATKKPSKKIGKDICYFFCGLLVLCLALVITPLFTNETIIGSVTELPNCRVLRLDPVTNEVSPTNETIEIQQVDHGVKFVTAKTQGGATFGLGFVQAKDRLWQLNFYRALSQGRLSEMLGPDPIPVDKAIRLMGLPRAVEEHFQNIREDERVNLLNYAAGINKVAENLAVYPLEMVITQTSFEPWTVKDSLGLGHLMAFFCATDWFGELLRERLLEVYDKDFVDQLISFKKDDF